MCSYTCYTERVCRYLMLDKEKCINTIFTQKRGTEMRDIAQALYAKFESEKIRRTKGIYHQVMYSNCFNKLDTIDMVHFKKVLRKARKYFDKKYFKIDYDRFGVKIL